jgi:formylglycine-generating enzyme required for sulfatase activity
MKSKLILLVLFAGFLVIFACDNPVMEQIYNLDRDKPAPKPITTLTYTVTFESNGGSAIPSQTVTEGDTATRPGNPTKGGYGFDDWYADSGLTTPFNFDTKITDNTTVHAWWKVEGMVWIPAGTFTMGSPESEPNRQPNETQHEVTLTKGFYMGKYLVTQAQYQAVMGKTIEEQQTLSNWSLTNYYGRGNNFPMYFVSWYDAIVFCNKLSMLEGLSPAYRISGSTDPSAWGTAPANNLSRLDNPVWDAVQIVEGSTGYRLPTEAQWEYACRAGTTTAFNWGTNQITTDQANYNGTTYLYNGSPAGISLNSTTEVGSFAPNAWGLYDMHGNVWEWCWDLETVPGSDRATRGGSWGSIGLYLRSAYRSYSTPPNGQQSSGFRVVRP